MILRVVLKNFLSFNNEVQFDMFPNMKRTSLSKHITMQHRSIFNYQRFSILIGTNRFLTKNSFSMYKCKPLFFSLLLILFVPPFFIQILYIKNQV